MCSIHEWQEHDDRCDELPHRMQHTTVDTGEHDLRSTQRARSGHSARVTLPPDSAFADACIGRPDATPGGI